MNTVKFKKTDNVLIIHTSYNTPGAVYYRYAKVVSFGAKLATFKNEDGKMFEKATHISQMNTISASNGFWVFHADSSPQVVGRDVAKQVIEDWHTRGQHKAYTADKVEVKAFPRF